jgi:diamine N-acetyltransferase
MSSKKRKAPISIGKDIFHTYNYNLNQRPSEPDCKTGKNLAGRFRVNMIIRKAVPWDYDALCALFDQVDALHRDKLPGMFQKPEGPVRDKKHIEALMANEDVALYIAEADGCLLGFVHAVVRESPQRSIYRQRRYALIDNMAVKKGERRKGIGQSLMKKASQWAIEKGATTIDLCVYDFNEEAVRFYQSLGFNGVWRFMSKPLKEI